jgi:hypothetical protein
MAYIVEVDQSGKIEDSGRTILAFSNDISHAIVIPARVKQAGFKALRNRNKSGNVARLMLFAAGLFLLLKEHLEVLNKVVIDTEYTGHEATIRSFLLRYIWQKIPTFEAKKIVFRQVGKKSTAHKKAKQVRKKRDRGYRKITEDELLRLLE